MPMATFINDIGKKIVEALSDPLILIGAVFSLGCRKVCKPNQESAFTWLSLQGACEGAQILAMLGETISDVSRIIDDGFDTPDDFINWFTVQLFRPVIDPNRT